MTGEDVKDPPEWLLKLKAYQRERELARIAGFDAVMRDMEQVRETPLLGGS